MPEYLITYRPDTGQLPETVQADSVTVEGETHVVFRQTRLVIGLPREIVVRRIRAAGVVSVDEPAG